MANVLYPKGRAHILGLATKDDMIADTIKAMLVDNSTTVYNSAHEFVSDLAAGGIIARSPALASKAVTGGVFTAANVTLPSVSGPNVNAIIIYKDTGADGTSVLLAWQDVSTYGPSGGDILISWNPSGIFGI